jgi:glycosyltransferase involved in cell wall biosynthesis
MELKVSIVMPAYNAELYIEEAINSILNQNYTNLELIICNDCSTDNTEKIIDKFCILDSRVKKITNLKNEGISKSVNKCINISNSDFILRMDADDIMLPERIKRQINFLMKNPNIYMVGGAIELIDSKGKVLKKRKYPKTNDEIVRKIYYYNPFCHPSIAFRRCVIDNVGIYNSKFDGAEDFDLILRIIKKYEVANLEDAIIKYRIHGSSISEIKSRKQEALTIYLRHKAFYEYNLKISKIALIYNFCQIISIILIPNKLKRRIYNFLR